MIETLHFLGSERSELQQWSLTYAYIAYRCCIIYYIYFYFHRMPYVHI